MKKQIFSINYHKKISNKLKKYLNKNFLTDKKIEKILITGSFLKNKLGKYEKYLGKKYDRTYSDIDLVLIVKNGFVIRKRWKLLAKRPYYKVYRLGYLVEKKIPVEAVILNKRFLKNKKAVALCEKKGIPMKLEKSRINYVDFLKEQS